jgi:hypothetical protein
MTDTVQGRRDVLQALFEELDGFDDLELLARRTGMRLP